MATRASGGDVRDLQLAGEGQRRIERAAAEMPALCAVRGRLEREQPLRGFRVGACLPVTSATANLVLALKGGGAEVALCASDPGSTDDAVAAALLDRHDVATYAARAEDEAAWRLHVAAVLAHRPQLTLDAGAHLATALHRGGGRGLGLVMGGTIGLRAPLEERPCYPLIAVSQAATDPGLAFHARCAAWLVRHAGWLGPAVHAVRPWLARAIAEEGA